VDEDSIKLEPLLQEGMTGFVTDGPVAASGYSWYFVHPLEPPTDVFPVLPPPGWVAAADKVGAPWLQPEQYRCPSSVVEPLPVEESEFGDIAWPPHSLLRLACFGSAPQTFRTWLGTAEGRGCFGWSAYVEPPMFSCGEAGHHLLGEPGEPALGGQSVVTVDPTLDLPAEATQDLWDPEDWIRVDVSGQFDHPAARSCRAVVDGSPENTPPAPESVVLSCRSTFVVTSLEVVEE
jgi:hypothetical protein